MIFPTLSNKQIGDLFSMVADLWVCDYITPERDEVIRNAKRVCSLLDWFWIDTAASKFKITKLVCTPDLFINNTWFSLGFVFYYANSYMASFERPSFPFLRYAAMCFNDGYGFKQWAHKLDLKEWNLCQTHEGLKICELHKKIGRDILIGALRNYNQPELTVAERVSLSKS